MADEMIMDLLEQACWDSILEIECPVCGAAIIAEPDAANLYCQECKQIVMQNPLIALGLI